MTIVYVVVGLFSVIGIVGYLFEAMIKKDMEKLAQRSREKQSRYSWDGYATGQQNEWPRASKEYAEDE